MVHCHDNIIPAAQSFREDRVRRDRPLGVDTRDACCLDGWSDLVDFLPSEESALAAVGIEARHTDAGFCDAHVPAGFVCYADDFQHPILLDPVAGFPQGNMGGNMHDPQVIVGKHHRVVFGACVVGVDFRVAGEVMPGQVHGLFVQRVRDGGIHLAVHGKFNDLAHIPEGSISGGRADLADG